ncbi:hypothetical protein IA817_01605 [Listeria seeligeri]|nr:hypothetical protein [Listeria seeligeri]MBC2197652.1 hypothetical protein [Listeria seeligeri]MBF2402723.1 hypothetical protein [Listeria seeligeri]MBF2480001.1 hypothetical protein [Listeria seeligeri]MBF2499786.1 hypothetical protein [Listeria seeligeri]
MKQKKNILNLLSKKSKESDSMSRKAKLDINELQEYINGNPDESAKDIAEHFEVSAKPKIGRKKRPSS